MLEDWLDKLENGQQLYSVEFGGCNVLRASTSFVAKNQIEYLEQYSHTTTLTDLLIKSEANLKQASQSAAATTSSTDIEVFWGQYAWRSLKQQLIDYMPRCVAIAANDRCSCY